MNAAGPLRLLWLPARVLLGTVVLMLAALLTLGRALRRAMLGALARLFLWIAERRGGPQPDAAQDSELLRPLSDAETAAPEPMAGAAPAARRPAGRHPRAGRLPRLRGGRTQRRAARRVDRLVVQGSSVGGRRRNRTADGMTKTFSVRRHGERRAFRLAVAARREMLQRVEDRPYLYDPLAQRIAARQTSAAVRP